MADPSNIQNILAALGKCRAVHLHESQLICTSAAQRQAGTSSQGPPPPMPQSGYAPQYSQPPGVSAPYGLPQPISSGSVDLGGIKPVNSGSVSIADAIAKARNIAAEKGVTYDPNRGKHYNWP